MRAQQRAELKNEFFKEFAQEARRYLKGMTGEDVRLEDLYFTSHGYIGGLPENASRLINHTKNNAKIERIRDALSDISEN